MGHAVKIIRKIRKIKFGKPNLLFLLIQTNWREQDNKSNNSHISVSVGGHLLSEIAACCPSG
jgi:hypothetical protein